MFSSKLSKSLSKTLLPSGYPTIIPASIQLFRFFSRFTKMFPWAWYHARGATSLRFKPIMVPLVVRCGMTYNSDQKHCYQLPVLIYRVVIVDYIVYSYLDFISYIAKYFLKL